MIDLERLTRKIALLEVARAALNAADCPHNAKQAERELDSARTLLGDTVRAVTGSTLIVQPAPEAKL